MRQIDAVRWLAFEQLLNQPDPPDLRKAGPRGHILTQPGARDRWDRWIPTALVWLHQRRADVLDEGWKFSATPSMVVIHPHDEIAIHQAWQRERFRRH